MTKTNLQKARANVKLYTILKVLTKRPYLPLIAIYFVQQSGLSIEQIGLLAGTWSLVSMVAEIPSGYMSDKWSRRKTLMLAGALGTASMAALISFQTFWGALASVIFEATAYAFLSGTGQAMLHDSLVVLDRPSDYAKAASRAQSTALFVNVAIIALAPATYALDSRLPFIIGAIQFITMIAVGFLTTDFAHKYNEDISEIPSAKGIAYIKRHLSFLMYATAAGVFGATWFTLDFQNLAFVEARLNPESIGFVFSATSLLGAIIGRRIHVLESLHVRTYAAVDVCFGVAMLGLFATGQLALMIVGFIVGVSFWRYRILIYDQHTLKVYRTKHKATLLSVVQNTTQLSSAAQSAAMGLIVGVVGLSQGFLIASAFTAAVGLLFILAVAKYLAAQKH